MKNFTILLMLLSVPLLVCAQQKQAPASREFTRRPVVTQVTNQPKSGTFTLINALGEKVSPESIVPNKRAARKLKTAKPTVSARLVKKGVATDIKPGYARIVVKNEAYWDDGSGYQLLLDPDATAFSMDNVVSGGYWESTDSNYDEWEYKLPANAKMTMDTNFAMVAPNGGEIEVPAGTYDWMILNPSYNAYYIGGGVVGDNDVLVANTEYEFFIYVQGGLDHLEITPHAPYDIAISNLKISEEKPWTNAEPVHIDLINTGENDWTGDVTVNLIIDEIVKATEIVSFATPLASGETYSYTLSNKADLSVPGKHKIEVAISSKEDMIPTNNEVSTEIKQPGARPLPVYWDFQDGEDLDRKEAAAVAAEDWLFIDNDGNGFTWKIGDDWMGSYYAQSYGSQNEDDYLVTFNPVVLPAGTNNIKFEYSAANDESKNLKVEVLYGKAPTVEALTNSIIKVENISSYDFAYAAADFNVAEAGEYYFAFRAYNEENIKIDNIRISNGSYIGTPDAYLESALPAPSPLLTAEEVVRVELFNRGTSDIKTVKLSYAIKDAAPVEETFTLTPAVASGASRVIEFTQKADFSKVDIYPVTLTVLDAVSSDGSREVDAALENNVTLAEVNKMKVASTPFYTNFTTGLVPEHWVSVDGSWFFNHYYNGGNNTPIYSCGVNLTAGKTYEFGMNYIGGFTYFSDIPSHFYILYGKAGTDISTWEVIEERANVLTMNDWINEKISFSPTESGVYQFAISPDSYDGNASLLGFKEISVDERADYDARILSIKSPTMIPVSQAQGFPIDIAYQNNGLKKADIDITLTWGDETLGSTSIKNVASKKGGSTAMTGKITNATANTKNDLVATPSIAGQADAVIVPYAKPLEITSSTMAYDNTEDKNFDPTLAIGTARGQLGCGMIFNLSADDIITGVTVGWAGEDALEIPIMIFEYDAENNKLGNLILSTSIEKAEGLGWNTYSLNPRYLHAGSYVIEVLVTNFIMAVDNDLSGVVAVYDPLTEAFSLQNGYGYPAIRAEFGEAELTKTDLKVAEILKPAKGGVFSVNEPVVAVIENMGSETTVGKATLTVDGTEVATKNVEVKEYSTAEVDFTADLSKEGSHTVVVSIKAEGDVNSENDEMQKTVECRPYESQYILDFENCEDFATEEFDPAWTSYDGDGQFTWGFQSGAVGFFSFPGAYGTMGFIAFNPSATKPAMGYDNFQPYEGVRYGMAIGARPEVQGGTVKPNDDWLISPKLMLPKENAYIKFYAKSPQEGAGEALEVLVSETDNNPESFTCVKSETVFSEDGWAEINASLNEYAGKDVHVAIRYVSEGKFALMVDNIEVSKPTLGANLNTVVTPEVALYPNPAVYAITITCGVEMKKIEICSTAGATVYSANVNDNVFRYNVTSLTEGVYFARVYTAAGISVVKFIVK